jgi:hypothetical protein
MAPPGTKVLIHEKSGQRQSWDSHATEGWYLGPANDHYRCYRVFTNKTKAERIIDTIECFPQHTKNPYATPTQVVEKAAHDIIQVLKNPTPSTAFAHVGHSQHEAIKALANIFNKHITSHHNQQQTVRRKFRGWKHPLQHFRGCRHLKQHHTNIDTLPATSSHKLQTKRPTSSWNSSPTPMTFHSRTPSSWTTSLLFNTASEGAFLWVMHAPVLLFKDSVVFSTESDE